MSTTQLSETGFSHAEAEAFAGTIAGIINSGAVAIMVSVGHRLGLFDLMAGRNASTSAEIADAADLNERYVREWLAALVMGGVVRYDPESETYILPAAHAACLTREAPLGNLAVYAQFVPMAGSTQEMIIDRFRNGGGTEYGDYPCFHTIMSEDSLQTVVASLFDTILPLAPGLTERLEDGIDVLDAGCGAGGALIALARRFPNSRFTGYDLCDDVIARARRDAGNLGNITFEQRDLTGFSEPECYDLIMSFDAIHDQRDPQGLLAGIHASLKPGGIYLVQDIGGSARLENNTEFPMAAFLYTASCTHCMPISLGQGGEGLGTMWGWETAEAMLRIAGFEAPMRRVLPHDPMNVWFVSEKA